MVIYGKNPIKFRLEKRLPVKHLYLQFNFGDDQILDLARKANVTIEFVDVRKLSQIAHSEHHQGIAARIGDFCYHQLEDLDYQSGLILILDGIEDPHNFGAIIRTAEAAGVGGIIIRKDRAVEVTPTVYKVSTGAVDNVKIARVTNLSRAIEYLKTRDYWVVGLEGDGTDHRQVDYSLNCALVIGSEGKGLSQLVRRNCDYVVALPMKGHVNSLNASAATAAIVYYVVSSRLN